MNKKIEIFIIYITALIQGLALVSVPAASSVFTDSQKFGLSEGQYGTLFIPLMICAILGSLLGPVLARKFSLKGVFLTGLVFNLSAMAMIAFSQVFINQHNLAFGILLMGTTALGAGFGTTLPMINTYAQGFFPDKSAVALTALHTLVGAGTALAPILASVLINHFEWWLLPLSVVISLIAVMILTFNAELRIGLELAREPNIPSRKLQIPRPLIVFIIIAVIYGFIETIFGNWAIIFIEKEKMLSTNTASYALATFWGMLTLGRLLISGLSVKVAPSYFYRGLPVLIVLALLIIPAVYSKGTALGGFGLAGFACSAFFPLVLSFAQVRYAYMAEVVSGLLMAAFMVGYGLASFGTGQMVERLGLNLSQVYSYSAIGAGILIVLAFYSTKADFKKTEEVVSFTN